MNNDTIEALKEARQAVMLKYYCQFDNRLATPLANACPELGRFLGMVGDLITQLEAASVKQVDIEAGAKALAMEYWRECYDAEMGEVLDWETPELYAEDNWRIYKRQTRAIAQSFGLPVGGEGER